MLTIEQINASIDQVVDAMKKGKQKGKPPTYHNTYKRSVDMADAIRVHAEYGVPPDHLVSDRYPNQTDQEYQYALKNYQQVTMPVFLDAVHTMQRAFSDNNWSIDYGEDESDFRNYLEVEMPETPLKLNFEAYMFQVVPSLKMVDAMGCIAIKPWFVPTIEVEGEVLIDGQTMFEPIPQYYSSEQLVAYMENKFYVFLTDEKSMVEWGNTTVNEGLVFEVYDDTFIYKVTQVGRKVDYDFETTIYYQHDLGYCPVERLKGIPANLNGEIIFQSLFLFAVPSLNDVVIDSMMLRSIKAASVFPYRVMTGNICDNTMDLNGEIQNCDGTGWFRDLTTGKSIACPSCLGTGMKNRISPHGVLLLRPESQLNNDSELKASQPAMYFVEPSTATPSFLRDEIDGNLNKARNILHLRTSDSQVKGNENLTATGMVLDEKALYSTVKMFSDQVFDLYEWGLKTIGLMRYGDSFEMPVVTRSITFDFATEYEYMERISLAIKNGLPPFVVYEIVYRYIKTMFYNETDRAMAFDLLVSTDRLLVMSNDQINIEVTKGTVATWEVVLHDSGITLIRELVEQNSGFLDQEPSAQREQLIAAAQAKADSIRPAQPVTPTRTVEDALAAVRGQA